MIASSQTFAILVDLAVIAVILAVVIVSRVTGMFRKGKFPLFGRILVMSGLVVVGLFYLADLIIRLLLPAFVGDVGAAGALAFLHFEIQLYSTLLSLVLICAGFIVVARQRRKVEDEIVRSDKKLASIQRQIIESEKRFRSFLEQTPNAVYCYECKPPVSCDLPASDQVSRILDAVLVDCNQVFADSLGMESPALAIGTAHREMSSARHAESYQRFLQAFIDSGYRQDGFDLDYKDSAGSDRAVKIIFAGVVENNELIRIWGTEIDVLEQKRTKVALAGRHRFQEFVATISSNLIKAADDNAGETLLDSLERVCVYMGSDRANIVWFDIDNNTAKVLYHWNEHGGAPWVELSLEKFPWMAFRILSGNSVAVSTVDGLPGEAATDVEGMKELGLKSVLAVPLVIGHTTLGAFTLGNIAAERSWTNQDITDACVIADLCSNVVVRIDSRLSLDNALSELRIAKERLEAENTYLRHEISSTHGFNELIGESRQLRECLHKVEQVAATNTSVLIQGETGTGKELIARAIHERSERSDRPLVKVNCAALPANLIESELFGYEKGAFTGATSRKRGRFDLADGGTLFLDEIGDFPLELQGKLLRVVQDGEFQRLGGTETISSDVRLVAATNRDLPKAVDDGEFRADLFYRINTFPIRLPRLSERNGDISILAQHFASKHAARLGKEVIAISSAMMEQLNAYAWPGNVRELEGVIQRALISATEPVLELPEPLDVPGGAQKDGGLAAIPPRLVAFRVAERQHIEQVLDQACWVIEGNKGAAVRLGIPASTLRSKMKKLGIGRSTHNI